MTRILSALTLVAFFSTNSFGDDQIADLKGLETASKAFTEAFNSHDASALSALFTVDTDVHYQPDPPRKGREEVKKSYVDFFEKNPKAVTKLTVLKRTQLADGIVVEDGTYEDSGYTDEPNPVKGMYTTVYVKKDDKWLIRHDRSWKTETK